jgi:hypothetical protein
MKLKTLKEYPCASGVDCNDWDSMDAKIHTIAKFFIGYAEARGLRVLFTSLIRTENDGMSKSRTHQEGRAVDCSVRGWTVKEMNDCREYLDVVCSNIGAITTSGKIVVALLHDSGHSLHLHLQCRRS